MSYHQKKDEWTSPIFTMIPQRPRTDLNERVLPRLPQHESLYPIGLKSVRIEIPNGGSHYIDFSKTDFY